jgi:hypothetical protein
VETFGIILFPINIFLGLLFRPGANWKLYSIRERLKANFITTDTKNHPGQAYGPRPKFMWFGAVLTNAEVGLFCFINRKRHILRDPPALEDVASMDQQPCRYECLVGKKSIRYSQIMLYNTARRDNISRLLVIRFSEFSILRASGS